MRKLLTLSLLSAMPIALAATFLVVDTGDHGPEASPRPPAPATAPTTGSPATAPATAPAAAVPETPAATTPHSEQPPATAGPTAPPAVHFLCPEGGMDDIVELQAAVDEGHQPWRLSPQDVAAACTFGVPGTVTEQVGPSRYHVTQPATGKGVYVDLAQPLGAGRIWVVTNIEVDS